jgi:EAL domain-containing protein (putative c-di-GMP-specific phosphodiesterase class I)
VGLAHIARQEDGTSAGVWGLYALKSAFQPIFAFRDRQLRVAAYEGLLRPFRNGQPASPAAFFSSVPETDRLHVETLARTLHLLNAGACLDAAADIFVNFDPSFFTELRIADGALRDMRLVLHEAQLEPRRIVCELTEQKSGSEATLKAFVHALRRHGYRIAVDDYGADGSDMKRIGDLRPDIVKFDAHWVGRLMDCEPGIELLSSMAGDFRSRGIAVVFEGIEDGRQLEIAERCGASMVQGFALARPEFARAGLAESCSAGGLRRAPAGSDVLPGIDGTLSPEMHIQARKHAFGRRKG